MKYEKFKMKNFLIGKIHNRLILFTAISMFACWFAQAADLVTGNILNEKLTEYDGKIVVYKGEAIGDILGRGDYLWVNVKNGNFLIGVWMKSEDAKSITHLGKYKEIGDFLRITGVYHSQCPEHWGENDIHATTVEIIRAGKIESEELDYRKVWESIIIAIVTLMFICYSHKRLQKENPEQPG